MPASPSPGRSSEQAAALLIVLAFVVLLTGVTVAYLSRSTTDRQLAQTSFHDTNADLIARSAFDTLVGDFRWEIVDGSQSPAPVFGSTNIYIPRDTGSGAAANMVPQRSGNTAGAPNLIRRSVRADPIPTPGHSSRAAAVSSAPSPSATPNRGEVIKARWNKHYLLPKLNTGDDGTEPIAEFTAPDWVFVTQSGPFESPAPSQVIGRYAYAVYDEGGLLDMNVAGYPTDPSTTPVPAQRVGRKGSLAYADLTALGNYPIPNGSGNPYQVDKLVGWRNYAITQPTNNFPDSNFAENFQSDPARAAAYFTSIISNTNGFLGPGTATWNTRTDQAFVQRQELMAFRAATQFSSNALQYLGTFSRETNAPSFSPQTPVGSTIDYATLANSPTPSPSPINPNFLRRRVTTAFTRFDGTSAAVGEPLVKTRFPLSRLAWITYKGPSASLATGDPVYQALINAGVSATTIQAGTSANILKCFGLVWDSRAYVPATATTNSQGKQWVYVSPSSLNTGGNFDPVTNPTGNPASDIKRLDIVASENREPDFFELLRATILDGSLGQSTNGGVTSSAADRQGPNTFPDLHMSNKALHVLTIGASVIDQADPDSVPTRIQLKPSGASVWWTAYGVESLPYITQIYPISGGSGTGSVWTTYLLFQVWNPHIGAALPTPAPQVRLRVDGNIGIFNDDGTGQTFFTSTHKTTPIPIPPTGGTPVAVTLTSGALGPGSTPAPLSTPGPVQTASPSGGTLRFEVLPAGTLQTYVGLRLPDFTLGSISSGLPTLELYFGDTTTSPGNHPNEGFNATMEWTVDGGTTWIPYNHFMGITDRNSTIGGVSGSWINGTSVPVRRGGDKNGKLNQGQNDNFNLARLTDSNQADCLMKSDPRATRFGIFQFSRTAAAPASRLTDSLWPTGSATLPNGYGGAIADPAGPVEHAPLRFSTAGGGNGIYFPATLCLNNSVSTPTRTSYADGDSVIRPADARYPDPSVATTGSSTPYYSTSTDYHPVMLNRPFRNVGELGYAFRDLPWKTLDFFTDKSADAGLLDIFSINDGAPVLDANGNIIGMASPTTIAGKVSLNSTQAADFQSVLAGTIMDEINSTTVNKTGTGDTDAPVLAANIVNAMNVTANPSATPAQNRSELITRAGLPTAILPVPGSGPAHDQRVKARREVVARAMSSVSQTAVWNLLIDMVAQSGHFKPGAVSLQNGFVVEGEQHYWAHVAIDRFTGQVIDRQVEEVQE